MKRFSWRRTAWINSKCYCKLSQMYFMSISDDWQWTLKKGIKTSENDRSVTRIKRHRVVTCCNHRYDSCETFIICLVFFFLLFNIYLQEGVYWIDFFWNLIVVCWFERWNRIGFLLFVLYRKKLRAHQVFFDKGPKSQNPIRFHLNDTFSTVLVLLLGGTEHTLR